MCRDHVTKPTLVVGAFVVIILTQPLGTVDGWSLLVQKLAFCTITTVVHLEEIASFGVSPAVHSEMRTFTYGTT